MNAQSAELLDFWERRGHPRNIPFTLADVLVGVPSQTAQRSSAQPNGQCAPKLGRVPVLNHHNTTLGMAAWWAVQRWLGGWAVGKDVLWILGDRRKGAKT